MKKSMFFVSLLIITSFTLASCTKINFNRHKIYKPGKVFHFDVSVYEKDSLVNQFPADYKTDKKIQDFMSLGMWKYRVWNKDSTSTEHIIETNVTERTDKLELFLPEGGIMEDLENAPPPMLNLPLKVHDKWKSKKSRWQVAGTESLVINGSNINCWVINASKKTDTDEMRAKYYFNDSLGFVKMSFFGKNKKSYNFELKG